MAAMEQDSENKNEGDQEMQSNGHSPAAIQRSAQAFFAQNMALLGLNNEEDGLFYTIKELVDNAVDGCIEKYKKCWQTQQWKSKNNKNNNDNNNNDKSENDNCNDLKMYAQSIEVRVEALAAKETDTRMKAEMTGRNRKNTHLYRVTIRDTGTGVKYSDIKLLFGNFFSSTKVEKFGKIGCFGVGVRGVLLYAHKFTTNGMIDIKTKTTNQQQVAHFVLKKPSDDTDINIPNGSGDVIDKIELIENDGIFTEREGSGTLVETIVPGNMNVTLTKLKIQEYFKMIAKLTSRFVDLNVEFSDFKRHRQSQISNIKYQNANTMNYNMKEAKDSKKQKMIRVKQVTYQIKEKAKTNANGYLIETNQIAQNINQFGIDLTNALSHNKISAGPLTQECKEKNVRITCHIGLDTWDSDLNDKSKRNWNTKKKVSDINCNNNLSQFGEWSQQSQCLSQSLLNENDNSDPDNYSETEDLPDNLISKQEKNLKPKSKQEKELFERKESNEKTKEISYLHDNINNKITIKMFINSNYVYPIENNDKILKAIKKKVDWGNYGILFQSEKNNNNKNVWHRDKDSGMPYLNFKTQSGQRISLNMCIHIGGCGVQYENLKKTKPSLSSSHEKTLISCIDNTLQIIKNENFVYLRNKTEIQSMDMVLRDIPGISQSIAMIILNLMNRKDRQNIFIQFCQTLHLKHNQIEKLKSNKYDASWLINKIQKYLFWHCVTDQQWHQFGINTNQITSNSNRLPPMMNVTFEHLCNMGQDIYKKIPQSNVSHVSNEMEDDE